MAATTSAPAAREPLRHDVERPRLGKLDPRGDCPRPLRGRRARHQVVRGGARDERRARPRHGARGGGGARPPPPDFRAAARPHGGASRGVGAFISARKEARCAGDKVTSGDSTVRQQERRRSMKSRHFRDESDSAISNAIRAANFPMCFAHGLIDTSSLKGSCRCTTVHFSLFQRHSNFQCTWVHL